MSGMKPKISSTEKAVLIIIALLFDSVNGIPLLNIVTGAVSFVFFQGFFFMKGVKKAHYSAIGNGMELIPWLSALPATTAGVIATIIANGREEKAEQKAEKEKKVKEMAELSKKIAAQKAWADKHNETLDLAA